MPALLISHFFQVLHEGACDTVCTAPGRFPNNTRDDCRGYVMCLKGATSITHYNLVCPEQSVYSHIDSQCTNVTSYECFSNHTCRQEGNYINYLSNNCDSYIACIQDLNMIISARIVKCPEDMIFSASEGVCVNSTTHKCVHESPKIDEVSKVPETTEVQPKDSTDSPKNDATFIKSLSVFVLFLSVISHFNMFIQ